MKMEVDASTLRVVTQLIGDVFTIATDNTFMHIFFQRAINRFALVATYIAYFLAFHFAYELFNNPEIIIGINLLFVFLITYNYRSRLRTRIVATIYLNAITMIVETLTVSLARMSDRIDVDSSMDSAIISLLCCIIAFFIVVILKNINMFRMSAELPTLLCVAVCVIPAGSILVLFIMVACRCTTYLFAVINTSALFLLNLIVFNLYYDLAEKFNQTIRIKVVEQQNAYYEKQLAIMMEAQGKIKCFRHDSKTKIMVVQNMLANGDYKRAAIYLEEMGLNLKAKEEIVSTGNVPIDAVINYKLQDFEEDKITLDLNLTIPEKMQIDAMDIAILLGNLLDNAVTAARRVEGERKITLHMQYDRNILYITVENPYEGKLNLSNGKYFTTKKDKENHGIGMVSVQNIVDKYQGLLEIQHVNHLFHVDVVLYLCDFIEPAIDDTNITNTNEKFENSKE